jgi:hypothetical protein
VPLIAVEIAALPSVSYEFITAAHDTTGGITHHHRTPQHMSTEMMVSSN